MIYGGVGGMMGQEFDNLFAPSTLEIFLILKIVTTGIYVILDLFFVNNMKINICGNYL